MRFDFKDLRAGESRSGNVCLLARDAKTTRKGDPYLTLTLGNRSGKATARIWSDNVPQWNEIQCGTAVSVDCTVVDGWNGGGPELSVQRMSRLPSDHPVRLEVNPGSSVPRAELVRRFRDLADLVVEPEAHVLLNLVLDFERDGKTLWEDFVVAPAAMTHHHATIGGLLEHAIEVATMAHHLASVMPYSQLVDPSLTIVAALLHDLGKVDEYRYGPGEPIGISEFGRLRSHLCRGSELVGLAVHSSLAYQAGVLSRETVTAVQHVIESHHGEFGSAVQPACMEAMIIHIADLASARLRGMLDTLEAVPLVNDWAIPSKWKKRPVWNLLGARDQSGTRSTGKAHDCETNEGRWRAIDVVPGGDEEPGEVVLELDSTMAAYLCYLMSHDLRAWAPNRRTRLSREEATAFASFLGDQLPTDMRTEVPALPPDLKAS